MKTSVLKFVTSLALAASVVPVSNVYAEDEGSSANVTATSVVSWCGDIGWGYGTYPQRALNQITVEFNGNVATDLNVDSFSVIDTLYKDTGVAMNGVDFKNGALTVDSVSVDGNKVVLNVSVTSGAGVLTSGDGNYRRILSEFEVVVNEDIKDADGNVLAAKDDVLAFDQKSINNLGSDEFEDLILTSDNAGNNIYVKYFLPENYNSDSKYPMVVHMTGGGQQYAANTTNDPEIYGNDNFGIELDIDLTPYTFEHGLEDTIVVSIQALKMPDTQPEGYDASKDINQVIEHFLVNFAVDADRVYGIGNSQGGVYMSRAVYYQPELYAAYLPCNTSLYHGAANVDTSVEGYETTEEYIGTYEYCKAIADEEVKVWFHVGRNDFTGAFKQDELPYALLQEIYAENGYSEDEISELVKMTIYEDSDFEAVGSTYNHGATGLMCLNSEVQPWLYAQRNSDGELTVTASYDQAAEEIVIPMIDEEGNNIGQPVSDSLKTKLDTTDLTASVNRMKKTITVDYPLVDVNLTSDYRNGASPAGISFFNFMNFYTNVLQTRQIADQYPGYSIVDVNGKVVDEAYIAEFIGLLDQINNFDTTTDLKYDYDSVYDAAAFAEDETRGGTDVIATSEEGNVSFRFHIDSHGWWGYDLGAHDSITGVVVAGLDDETAHEQQHDLTTKYGNFFVIDMQSKGNGDWYMINNTDLENPTIYVSADGKEAFMIDVDFYGENVINDVIKNVIGEECESLKIFATHNHGDHVNNLAKIAEDERLQKIITIVWPENEPHSMLDGVDLVELFDNTTIADMEKITVADHEFQFLEIPDEHTPGGGMLADLTNKVLYSGDSLGAQIHLGGTTIMLSGAQAWLDGANKATKFIEDNGIGYILGAHTPYLNTTDFAKWVATAVEYALAQYEADPTWNGGLVIVENGEVVQGPRMGEIFQTGLTDREELVIASVNFRNDMKPAEDDDDEPVEPGTDEDPKPEPKPSDNKPGKGANTSDESNAGILFGAGALSLAALFIALRRRLAK